MSGEDLRRAERGQAYAVRAAGRIVFKTAEAMTGLSVKEFKEGA